MSRRVIVGMAILVLAVLGITFLPPGGAVSVGGDQPGSPLTTPSGFTNAEFELLVYRNGSTRWTVRASRPLENGTEIEQFRVFESRFESTETDAFRNFKVRARRLVAFGANATGREMNATRFGRSAYVAELGQTRGVVELSFLWTNFARTDGRRLIVDDVFEGGMFVDSGQRLVMKRGPALAFRSVDPPPDSLSVDGNLTASGTVSWRGKRNFADRRPRAVLVPREMASDGASSSSGTGTAPATVTVTPASQSGASGGNGMLLFVVGVVVIGLGGGFLLYSGAVGGFPSRRPDRSSEQAARSGASTESSTTVEADRGVADEQLLSDEDRVLQLLEEHDGRMKQVNIVEETDWSKSKVSMVLSDMEDDGKISKLRVGRENIISKTGNEPDAAGSPFENE